MKFSKQAILGSSVFLGGSVLLYATVHQVMNANPNPSSDAETSLVASNPTASVVGTNPLTADMQTEKNILAEKQKLREQRVEAQEQAAQQYLTEQQRIEAEALARSRAENQLYTTKPASTVTANNTSVTAITTPVVTPRPTAINTINSQTPQAVAQPATPVTQAPSPKPIPTTVAVTPRPQPTVPATVKPIEQTPTKPVVKTTATNPSSYQVKAGEGLIGLSRRYNVPVEALAMANGLSTNSTLHVGQNLVIPNAKQAQSLQQLAHQREQQQAQQRQAEINRKKQEAVQKEQQRQQEIARKKQEAILLAQQQEQQRQAEINRKKQEALAKQQAQALEAKRKQDEKQAYKLAQDKLKQARQTVKETDAKGTFGVQIALATDQKKADEIAKKLQSAGYRVKTSQTSRGVRVVVGPENGKVAALALKDKINSDPRVPVENGWVLYW
ncbi:MULTISPECIES: LysM peptidoglycan-binding domain-containing protein [unclassified Moraxella]|uniref:SPOR and LysM peptidoglycan-binding domain-containing protein n=1 Tax=unclassified Moraxella TaxID=2685852 RepID=UPI003AF97530